MIKLDLRLEEMFRKILVGPDWLRFAEDREFELEETRPGFTDQLPPDLGLNEWTRSKLREESFLRRILPPVPVP